MHHEANKQIKFKKNPAIYGFYKIMNNDIRKPKSIIVHNLDYIMILEHYKIFLC